MVKVMSRMPRSVGTMSRTRFSTYDHIPRSFSLFPPRGDDPFFSPVIRRRSGAAELPRLVRDPIEASVVLRHRVEAEAQHAVECSQPRDQLGPRRSGCDELDERVACRVAYAHEIARAFGVRGLGAELVDQLGPRRFAARLADDEEVVIEHVEPLLDQREIGPAYVSLDAELRELLEIRRHDDLAARVARQV